MKKKDGYDETHLFEIIVMGLVMALLIYIGIN
jgi:hypothetical protein